MKFFIICGCDFTKRPHLLQHRDLCDVPLPCVIHVRTGFCKQASDDTTEWIDKVNGRVSAQGKKVVSKDGMTLTITTDGQSRVTVYDRQ